MSIAKNHWVTFKCTVIVISLHYIIMISSLYGIMILGASVYVVSVYASSGHSIDYTNFIFCRYII